LSILLAAKISVAFMLAGLPGYKSSAARDTNNGIGGLIPFL
jgi:hypothetical protein